MLLHRDGCHCLCCVCRVTLTAAAAPALTAALLLQLVAAFSSFHSGDHFSSKDHPLIPLRHGDIRVSVSLLE
jgi:hypothetical protein